MVVFEIQEVELDHCVKCGGTWLDAGEMELLMEGAVKAGELLDSMVPDVDCHENPRPCPICEKQMQKVKLTCGDAGPVTLDKCKNNDGMWFDKGELSGILQMGESPCAGTVVQLLRGVFGWQAVDEN
jgi:Zn-finger nucleic acid-binding protein